MIITFVWASKAQLRDHSIEEADGLQLVEHGLLEAPERSILLVLLSVDGNTCLLAGAEQEGPAHNPCATQEVHTRPRATCNLVGSRDREF